MKSGQKWKRSLLQTNKGFPGGASSKESAAKARDVGSIPGKGRSLGGGHGSPLQYSCLENPLDRRAWWATVHGVTQSWTQLKRLSTQGRIMKPGVHPPAHLTLGHRTYA